MAPGFQKDFWVFQYRFSFSFKRMSQRAASISTVQKHLSHPISIFKIQKNQKLLWFANPGVLICLPKIHSRRWHVGKGGFKWWAVLAARVHCIHLKSYLGWLCLSFLKNREKYGRREQGYDLSVSLCVCSSFFFHQVDTVAGFHRQSQVLMFTHIQYLLGMEMFSWEERSVTEVTLSSLQMDRAAQELHMSMSQ